MDPDEDLVLSQALDMIEEQEREQKAMSIECEDVKDFTMSDIAAGVFKNAVDVSDMLDIGGPSCVMAKVADSKKQVKYNPHFFLLNSWIYLGCFYKIIFKAYFCPKIHVILNPVV